MLELVFYGIVFGSIISLGAIGLTLVFGIIRFANFAHGDLMSLGAYFALFMVSGVLSWIGVPDTTFGSLSFGQRIGSCIANCAKIKAAPSCWPCHLWASHLLFEC
jgi:branched-subunit amino acid ABC-type transport system permease component